jgi:hypothetical protein
MVISDENWSYSLLGRDKDFFDLVVSPKGVVAVTFKNSPNYKSKPTYSLVLKVNSVFSGVEALTVITTSAPFIINATPN